MRMLYVLIAVATVVAIAAAGIALVDLPYRLQDGKRISVVGQVVCLPHKQGLFGGAATDECAFGFMGDDNKHYAINNMEQFGQLAGATGTDKRFQISGTFTYGASGLYEKYDIVGKVNATAGSEI